MNSDISYDIEKFLSQNGLGESLSIFKNEMKKNKNKNLVISKKQSYQLQNISNLQIDLNNPENQNKLREHLQKTDVKILRRVFERMKTAAKKNEFKNLNERAFFLNSQSNIQTSLTKKKIEELQQLKFFQRLVEKENKLYEKSKEEETTIRNRNPQLEESRQYCENEWENPNQLGYDVNEFHFSEFSKVCRQLNAARTSLEHVIKEAAFPEGYYAKIAEFKDRNNINEHDKLYSRMPPQVRFRQKEDEQEEGQEVEHIVYDEEGNPIYPLEVNGVVYDCYDLKVIYDRDKTGFQEERDLRIVINEVLAGKYQVVSFLGQAQFSNAVEVKDLTTQRRYCLKIIKNNKDFFDQSIDEIKILRYVKANCNPDDSHLLNLYDFFYHKEHLMLLTELLKDTLLDAYRSNRAMFRNLRTLQLIGRQILIALQKLHSLHIAHTDLKPENILMKSYTNKTVKVIDLGSGVFFHEQPSYYIQTRSYRAPEVILGIPYDGRIDIWSLGCIMAEMFLGEVLFQSESVQGLLALMEGLRGPWPSWMLQKGVNVEKYFTKEVLIFEDVEEQTKSGKMKKTGTCRIYTPKLTNMKSRLKCENRKFLDFLSKCLKLDPSLRMSAAEALRHPFMTETIIDT